MFISIRKILYLIVPIAIFLIIIINLFMTGDKETHWDAFPSGIYWNDNVYALLTPSQLIEDDYIMDLELVKTYHPQPEYKIGTIIRKTDDELKYHGDTNCVAEGESVYKIAGKSVDDEIACMLNDGLLYRFINSKLPIEYYEEHNYTIDLEY